MSATPDKLIIDGSAGHSGFRFGSVRFIRVGMFRNRLGTIHFSDRFGLDNVGFGSGFHFYKIRSGTVLQIIWVWFEFKAQKTQKIPKIRDKPGKKPKNYSCYSGSSDF